VPAEELVVHGAREHNLKDVTVTLPRNALICITGLSGSGKSSLAFDTIYAEGQRRYVESLSAYARQFLQMMEKPDVDSIDGLSPAISIDQKTTSRNPRSTVGTVTEIYDYLRLLYARVGRPHCPVCGRPISGQSLESIVDQILALPDGMPGLPPTLDICYGCMQYIHKGTETCPHCGGDVAAHPNAMVRRPPWTTATVTTRRLDGGSQ